jgi:hypothetical protein
VIGRRPARPTPTPQPVPQPVPQPAVALFVEQPSTHTEPADTVPAAAVPAADQVVLTIETGAQAWITQPDHPAARATTPPAPRTAPARRTAAPAAGEQPRERNGRFAHYPLRRRAEQIHTRGHAALDGASTDREQLAAGVDFVRSALAATTAAGLHDPTAATATRVAITALAAAGDALTTAMHAWSPTP